MSIWIVTCRFGRAAFRPLHRFLGGGSGFTSRMGKDGKSMTLLLKRPLATGTYTVTWSAAGKDTHRMGSSFSFKVK